MNENLNLAIHILYSKFTFFLKGAFDDYGTTFTVKITKISLQIS